MKKNIPDIEKVYDLYSRRLYFSALRILGNSFEAEDVMQDTIILYHKYEPKKEIKNIGGWLQTVCIRKSVDALRSGLRERKFKEAVKAEYNGKNTCSMQEGSGTQEIRETGTETESVLIGRIKRTLSELPDSARMIVSLHLFEGYDYEEIAQITGLSESGIRSQYMRGKERLAEKLGKTTLKNNKED